MVQKMCPYLCVPIFLPAHVFAHESRNPTTTLPIEASQKNRLVRTVDALVSSSIFTFGIKSIVREDRPNHNDSRSFPSEHTSAAFSIATVQAGFDKNSALLWYLGATAVGVWRVTSEEHHWQDVAAGAAIGYFTAREVMLRPRGLLITPLFERGEVGFEISARF